MEQFSNNNLPEQHDHHSHHQAQDQIGPDYHRPVDYST